ncbi:CHC2 zinc finger domain-containing protein [Mucilaginibacter sp. UYCu711]|uniref:CHC2 zinc finger domain-containing protein n=1 Tax=Mucilaginibacter sp. UYCu711 TaxID=3156339 RepID=UPI003D1B96BB
MSTLLNARELKEQASIVDLLSRLGYQPVKKSGKEHFYLSMLRDSDTKPSMCVNDRLGVWFDHGCGKGGNIIDFGLAYWPGSTFNEVVEKIQSAVEIQPEQRSLRPRRPVKVRNYVIEEIKDLGTHPAITNYLKNRGVFEVARPYLSEIYYAVEDDKGQRKAFFSAGWQNETAGWEVRNKYFKGCLGNKGITFIPGDLKRVAVFEGFLDGLSWLKENENAGESLIILNTLTLLNEGIARAKQFSSIDIYFDHDPAGHQATKDFIKALPYATDRSAIYKGYNDYNDKLVDMLRTQPIFDPFERKRKGFSY